MGQRSHIFFLACFIAFAFFAISAQNTDPPVTPDGGVGTSCSKNTTICFENMKCGKNGTCECISGYHVDGFNCTYDYGKPCNKTTPCGSSAMFCNQSKCDCKKESQLKDGICKGPLKAPCDRTTECLTKFASCSKDKTGKQTCQCIESYKEDQNKCLAPPQGICSADVGCQDKNSNCTSVNGTSKCECYYGYNNETKACTSSGSIFHGSVMVAAFSLLLGSL